MSIYKSQIILPKDNLPNPSYIFPFRTSPIFDFKENKKIKILQQDNELSSSDEKEEESLNLEQTLSKFYDYSVDCYKKNMYETLIKEIEINEYLYYIGSKESFDILIIKIKCFMKLMIEEYENDLNNNTKEAQIIIKEYIIKIEYEFSNISKIIDREDPYQYEIITQIFCKFLIYLVKFTQKREEYCKSLAYITLGINMMKIFFIKKKITTNIKTYKRYIYLLLLLINQLIGEKNFKQALLYSENLLKIIEMAIKIMYAFKPKDKKLKERNDKSIIEIFRCIGFTYIYIGICFDNQKNLEMAFEAYKESFYFFMKIKSSIFLNIRNNNEKCIYDNHFIKLAHLLINNQKIKIEENKKRREENININDIIAKKNEQKKELYEKRKKLKLISSGLNGDEKRFNQIENNIYKNILTPKKQKLIRKLDKALMSLAYSEKKAIKKKGPKKNLSLSIMDNLCHYNLYDKLMSKKYHEFLMINDNLKISNPKDQEEFLQSINSYLTSTMEIKPHNDNKNKPIIIYREQKIKNSLSSGNIFNSKGKISSAKTPRNMQFEQYKNIFDYPKNYTTYNNKNNKKIIFKKNNSFASLKIDIPKKANNNYNCHTMNKSLSETYITSRTRTTNMIISKYKSNIFSNSKSTIKNRNYTDNENIINLKKNNTKKHYLSPKYFNKYMYLDKLTKKELDFQKVILSLKSNNSKLYYNDYYKELFINGKNKEEEQNQYYMFVKEKINQKILKNQKEQEKIMNNNQIKRQDTKIYKNLLKINNGNLFQKRGSIDINGENDFFDYKKKSNIDYTSDKDENIKKINEKSLFNLDYTIKNLRNKINERKRKLKYH